MLHCVFALARVVDKQLALIERLTTPEPSILPALTQMLPMFKDVLDSFRRPTRDDMGPAERAVMTEFESAHAKLVAEMEQQRAVARQADDAAKAPSTNATVA